MFSTSAASRVLFNTLFRLSFSPLTFLVENKNGSVFFVVFLKSSKPFCNSLIITNLGFLLFCITLLTNILNTSSSIEFFSSSLKFNAFIFSSKIFLTVLIDIFLSSSDRSGLM